MVRLLTTRFKPVHESLVLIVYAISKGSYQTEHGQNFASTCAMLSILHECSCFIEFIKKSEKRDKICCLLSSSLLFRYKFNKLNNT